ncbi:4-(cytidine 5'-diphospho)-2-C-methyl-D-erythritol kinase [Candidatus Oleimmundimicrobium sp.]|uniref:4-(cytidine 5'-diphospho)-2-C-methyl-D-erythritol kinase n=1 Tax=Candidatus Oleimmundimicrobium sp. TaxID=3060597 RepID=UPI0027164D5A|nr:4-(cytidine 5'-diphospho)-2-C-methyl-D-erythritol kinase [Candidatus Oleimmundimicrobium sp.]MDO8886305.1 4-(cytidine 5'-diphospho)-2-C-methyl-D-erythritol kinase [Candidatus Oleimmundimicrobium sp.]
MAMKKKLVRKVKIKAHAKINLYLDITGKRVDGYHNIHSLMQSILLADELVVSDAEDLKLIVSGEFKVPLEDNLVLKAAQTLQNFTKKKSGACISLNKKIPVAAGLGGGSADAAATLVGLNILWDLKLSLKDLQAIGEKIGADVPFCLQGGLCLVEGKGEKVSSLPGNFAADIVIVKPSFELSTSQVYSDFDKIRLPCVLFSMEPMIAALHKGSLRGVSSLLANVLEKPVISKNPIIREIKEKALQAGATGALMSGSGSSVFAIADSKEAALKIANHLKGFYENVIVTATSQKGIDVYQELI